MRTLVFSLTLFFVALSGLQAKTSKQWADKRVNRHMLELENKMYHQKKVHDLQNHSLLLKPELPATEFKEKPSSGADPLSLKEQSYALDTGESHLPVSSPVHDLKLLTEEQLAEQRRYEELKRAYYRYVKESLDKSGVKYELEYQTID